MALWGLGLVTGLPAGDNAALLPEASPAPLELEASPLALSWGVGNDTDIPGFDYSIKEGNSVLYAISTCEKYHATRAMAVHETWCKEIKSCQFYSDHAAKKPPLTIPIHVKNSGGLDPLRMAQMRYIRIFDHAVTMVLSNHGGKFHATKWVVVADDDTYIFTHNMQSYLHTLNAGRPIYTGHTILDKYYPVDSDGEGHTLDVNVYTHFACGGGGSVFSLKAMQKMRGVLPSCIRDFSPGHKWGGWQSDWVFGACAERAGVHLLDQSSPSRFGQFLTEKGGRHVQASDPGTKMFCGGGHGICPHPVSIHPLANPISMREVHKEISTSASQKVTKVKILLRSNDHIIVRRPGDAEFEMDEDGVHNDDQSETQ